MSTNKIYIMQNVLLFYMKVDLFERHIFHRQNAVHQKAKGLQDIALILKYIFLPHIHEYICVYVIYIYIHTQIYSINCFYTAI